MITLKNKDIYNYALKVQDFYKENSDLYLPVKSSFYIYKNFNILIDAATNIDRSRQNILERFGEKIEKGQYKIPEDRQEFVNQELNDLSELTQDLDITKVKLEDLKDVKLTLKQIEAISFMIQEESENKKEKDEDE